MRHGSDAFLSYTSELTTFPADKPYVRAAVDAILRAGFRPVHMGEFTAHPETPAEYCRAKLRECQLFIAIVGFRYGTRVAEYPELSYLDFEFEEAVKVGLPRFAFLLDDEASISRTIVDADATRIDQFRSKVMNSGSIVFKFRSADHLADAIIQGLYEYRDYNPFPARRGADLKWPQYDALPRNSEKYVERPHIVNTVRNALLAETGNHTPVVGLIGMSGAGKTTIARAIVGDNEVRSHFSGGIVWIDAGAVEPESLQSQLAQAYGDSRPIPSATEGISRMSQLLAGVRGLVVLDNVVSADQILAFVFRRPTIRVLVTTRASADVLGHAVICPIGSVMKDEALQILAKYSGQPQATVPVEASEIIERCNGLALALAIAGGMVREGRRWQMIAERLRRDLTSMNTPLGDYPLSLIAALEASISSLSVQHRSRFTDLVIFSGRDNVPLDIVAFLWSLQGMDRLHAEDLVIELSNRGLVRYDATSEAVTLHDLLLEYTKTTLSRQAISTIHAAFAFALLDRWGGIESDLANLASNLTLDHINIYGLTHIFDHLAQAGHTSLVHQILALEEPLGRRNKCFTVYESLGLAPTYLRAIRFAWRLAEADTDAARSVPRPAASISLEVRYALIFGSIATIAANVPVPLLVALVDKEIWSPQHALIYAQSIPNPRDRTKALTGLSARESGDRRRTLLTDALDLARTAPNPFARTRTLLDLSLEDDPAKCERILEHATRIGNMYVRYSVLLDAASFFRGLTRERVLVAALSAAKAIPNYYSRLEAFTVLNNLMPDTLPALIVGLNPPTPSSTNATSSGAAMSAPRRYGSRLEVSVERILNLARSIASEEEESALGPEPTFPFPEPPHAAAVAQAYELARGISHPVWRAKALTDLASEMPDPERTAALTAALDVANSIVEPFRLVRALAYIAQYLPEPAKRRMIDRAIGTLDDKGVAPYEKVRGCVELLTLIDGEERDFLLGRAIVTATNALNNPSERARAFALLVPYASPANHSLIVEQAARATAEIRGAYQKVRAISAVLNLLPSAERDSRLAEALEIAHTISNPYRLSRALLTLVPHIGPAQRPALLREALSITLAISGPYWQSRNLTRVAQRLKGVEHRTVLDASIEAARSITDPDKRNQALAAAAPLLDNSQLRNALNIAQIAGGRYWPIVTIVALFRRFLNSAAANGTKNDLLEEARKIRGPYWRAKAIAALGPYISEDESEEIFGECLRSLEGITAEDRRSDALVEIVQFLPRQSHTYAINIASAISDASCRARALLGMVPEIDPSLHPDLLQVVRNIDDASVRAATLARLSVHLPESSPLDRSLATEAFDTAMSIDEDEQRANSLIELAGILPSQYAQDAISASATIRDPGRRIDAVSRVLDHLEPYGAELVCGPLLDIASAVEDPHSQVRGLLAILPFLKESERATAYQTCFLKAQVISNPYDRVQALIRLLDAAVSPRDQAQLLAAYCLDIAMIVTDPYDCAISVLKLVPHLSQTEMARILTFIPEISSTHAQALLLVGLIEYLPSALMDRTFAMIEGLENGIGRAWVAEAMLTSNPAASENMEWASYWRTSLRSTALAGQRSVLRFLALAGDNIMQLGGREGVFACVKAIQDIERWWP